MRQIKVFIASPGDLAIERRAFKSVIDELNSGFGRGAALRFEPLGWEDALSQVGRRPQTAINCDVDKCDLFILVMWRRWGQQAPDAAPYSSYTEEEFYRALARLESQGSPSIVVLFKRIDPGQIADPGEQLRRVLEFRRKLELTRKVLYRSFDSELEFRNEIDRHLVAFATGELLPTIPAGGVPIVPDSIESQLEEYRAELKSAYDELSQLRQRVQLALLDARERQGEAKDHVSLKQLSIEVEAAKSEEHRLATAEAAAKAALEGNLEEARQKFAIALDGATNLRVLYLGYEFFDRVGEAEEAEALLRRWLAISGPEQESVATAGAYANLAQTLLAKRDYDSAEEMWMRSASMYRKLNHEFGSAKCLNSLGSLRRIRGDLKGAEADFRQALAIHERLEKPAGISASLYQLGLTYFRRGQWDTAAGYFRKALTIDQSLNDEEGEALASYSLAGALSKLGRVDEANALYRTAIELTQKLGKIDKCASGWWQLGINMRRKGELVQAKLHFENAHRLFVQLGNVSMATRLETELNGLINLMQARD